MGNAFIVVTFLAGFALVVAAFIFRLMLIAAAISVYFFDYIPTTTELNAAIFLAASGLFSGGGSHRSKQQ